MNRACRAGLALLGLSLPCGRAAAAQDLMAQARALQARGRLDSALTVAEAAARAEPQRAEAHHLVGDLAGQRAQQINNLSALGLARKCKSAYGRAVQLEPDNVRYLQALAGFLSQAPGIAGGNRDSALVLAERVRRLDEPAGTFLMADVLRRGNGRQKARADSVVDGWGRAHTDRAAQFRVAAYYGQSGRPERALAITERLVADDPTDVVARYAVARNLVVLRRDPGRAIGYLQQALAAPPPPATGPTFSAAAAWWRLGQAFVLLDQTDSARLAYERSLALDRTFRPARLSLDSLANR